MLYRKLKIDQFNNSEDNEQKSEKTEFPFTEPVMISSENQIRDEDTKFSFVAPDIIGEEQEAIDGYGTDEGEFLSAGEQVEAEKEADREMTRQASSLRKSLCSSAVMSVPCTHQVRRGWPGRR